MLHHPGEVLSVIKPADRDVKSADSDTFATVKMWDDNILTLVVDPKIAAEIKQGDKVMVDYRPTNVGSTDKPAVVQKQLITKIIRGDRADHIWKEYKEWYEVQKQKATQQMPSDYMG